MMLDLIGGGVDVHAVAPSRAASDAAIISLFIWPTRLALVQIVTATACFRLMSHHYRSQIAIWNEMYWTA
jgi:hypothetical protein